jgi:Inhibitor of apoptosis-promoting Bax1
MNNWQLIPTAQGSVGGSAIAQRNRVLRNTYWLLALSMVPTILGAWIGVTTGVMPALSSGAGLVVFLAGGFLFIFAIEKIKHSSAVVSVLLAFTLFMGLMLSRLLGAVLGLANGAASSCWPSPVRQRSSLRWRHCRLSSIATCRSGASGSNYVSATLSVCVRSLLAIFGMAGGRDE